VLSTLHIKDGIFNFKNVPVKGFLITANIAIEENLGKIEKFNKNTCCKGDGG
jgi:hypothetical protein